MFQRGRREHALDSSAEHDGGAAQQIAQADRRHRGGGLAQALGANSVSSRDTVTQSSPQPMASAHQAGASDSIPPTADCLNCAPDQVPHPRPRGRRVRPQTRRTSGDRTTGAWRSPIAPVATTTGADRANVSRFRAHVGSRFSMRRAIRSTSGTTASTKTR